MQPAAAEIKGMAVPVVNRPGATAEPLAGLDQKTADGSICEPLCRRDAGSAAANHYDVDVTVRHDAFRAASILHPHQIKSVWRRDLAAAGAVASLESRFEIGRAPFAFADRDERADHRADLVVKERARRGFDPDFFAIAQNGEAIERLHRRLGLAFGGTEGGEIVPADQALRRLVHGGGIERARHAPDAVGLERQIGAAVDDAVEIVALDGRKSRVEVVRDLFGRKHGDRLRAQMKVDGVAHRVGVPLFGEIDMRDLAERMHARIGAAGAAHRGALGGECRDGVGQRALDRGTVVLRLPAHIRRAVILERELVAGHQASSTLPPHSVSQRCLAYVQAEKLAPGPTMNGSSPAATYSSYNCRADIPGVCALIRHASTVALQTCNASSSDS